MNIPVLHTTTPRMSPNSALVLLVCALLMAAGCGSDQPEPLTTLGGTPSTSQPDTTGAPSLSETTRPDSTTGDFTATTETTVPLTVPPEEQTTTTSRPPVEVEPPTTEDLIDDNPPLVAPEEPVLPGPVPTVLLLPATAQEVVGWSERTATLGDGGGIDIVLDGWRVEHAEAGDGAELSVALFLTLVGAFETSTDLDSLTGPSALSLFYDGAREDGHVPVTAQRYVTGTDLAEPVDADRVDPLVWAPVAAGEERPLWFRWVVPDDTERLSATIANTVTFAVFPQDPGGWGNTRPAIAEPPADNPPAESLFVSCFTKEDCALLGMAGFDKVSMWFADEWEGGLGFEVLVAPPPTTSEGMTAADLRFWYEDQPDTWWYPSVDPWMFWVLSKGAVGFPVDMPFRGEFLYMSWDLPDGTTLVWKTTAMVQERLFADPDWIWDSTDATWARREAVATADRVCWALWTGSADPYGLFPEPVGVVGGDPVTVTASMVDWVLEGVCQ